MKNGIGVEHKRYAKRKSRRIERAAYVQFEMTAIIIIIIVVNTEQVETHLTSSRRAATERNEKRWGRPGTSVTEKRDGRRRDCEQADDDDDDDDASTRWERNFQFGRMTRAYLLFGARAHARGANCFKTAAAAASPSCKLNSPRSN